MKKITLTCVDAGGGHACGLAIGLKKHGQVTTVWQNRNKHGLDYLVPDAKYGYRKIPYEGDDLIIVSCITFDQLEMFYGRKLKHLIKGYDKVHIIVTDGRYARNPDYYNEKFEGFDVITTACKKHFREPLPVKTYYQPFDLSMFDQTKPDKIRIAHSPFVPAKFREKGTQKIVEACRGYDLGILTKMPWKRCMELKATAHIFIDQVDHYDRDKFKFKDFSYVWPALGKSGIEAMHLGCLTITYGKGYDTDIPAPPIVWIDDADQLKGVIDSYMNNKEEISVIAKKQQAWALKYASYDFQAKNVLT